MKKSIVAIVAVLALMLVSAMAWARVDLGEGDWTYSCTYDRHDRKNNSLTTNASGNPEAVFKVKLWAAENGQRGVTNVNCVCTGNADCE